MDRKLSKKIKKYQVIILEYLNYKASIKAANLPDCQYLVIADKTQHHYQLLTMGWQGNEYVHSISIHVSIAKDGKIWINVNWTDIDIAELFVKKGVPKSDIVLGFHKEYMRAFSEYAVN